MNNDLEVGKQIGRLTILKKAGYLKQKKCILYECQCECGIVKLFAASSLKAETSKSCGCLRKELTKQRFLKHGISQKKARLYRVWMALRKKMRLKNNNLPDYLAEYLNFREWAKKQNYNGQNNIIVREFNGIYSIFHVPIVDGKINYRTFKTFQFQT